MKTFVCTRCDTEKLEIEFALNGFTTRGYAYRCKDCEYEQRVEVRLKKGLFAPKRKSKRHLRDRISPYKPHTYEYNADANLWRNYRISLEDKLNMIKKQNNRCAICNDLFDQENNSIEIHVDHIHNEDKTVRGILCNGCNTGLGGFKDSIDIMLKAVKYVKRIGLDGEVEGTLSLA